MSREIGMKVINLEPAPRIGHTEYNNPNDELIKHVTGANANTEQARKNFADKWDFDLTWCTMDETVSWSERGRVTNMGHAVFTEDERDLNTEQTCPFEDIEQVLEFDAVEEYGLEEFDHLVKTYEELYQTRSAMYENQVVTGGYYKTVVSGASHTFGWDMFLMAAADQERFAKVLASFGEITMHHARAWAKTSIDVYIMHDDMVWTEGPFMPPDFYRSAIFPIYKKIIDMLHAAGKKVLYCCDGTFDMFMEDIAAAGADGFIFEPSNNFDYVVSKFGKTHCLVGSKVDCRTMTFDDWPAVKKEMDATFALAEQCAGLIWAVGNHIPFNVPLDITDKYFDYLKKKWWK
ncbi:MAG: hypothetical protein GXP32_08375 [Kiritimatiellaeota bacterium]|nr:hypothetical protein [Kiritimatiellota bacterium]